MKTNNNYEVGKAHKDLVYSIKGVRLNSNKVYVLKQKESKKGIFGFFRKQVKRIVTEINSSKPNYKNTWDHKGLF